MSPEGWLRATIWYDKLREPPETGSLQETIAFMVVRWRKRADVQKWLALYAILNREGPLAPNQLTAMRNLLTTGEFPYLEQDEDEVKIRVQEVMKKWVEGGPMSLGGAQLSRRGPRMRPSSKSPMGTNTAGSRRG